MGCNVFQVMCMVRYITISLFDKWHALSLAWATNRLKDGSPEITCSEHLGVMVRKLGEAVIRPVVIFC